MEQLSRAFICRKSVFYVIGFNSLCIKHESYLHYNNGSFCLGEGTPPDTRFIEDGVCELLKTRRVLKCSYPYGFFLQPGSTQKEIFELMQVI